MKKMPLALVTMLVLLVLAGCGGGSSGSGGGGATGGFTISMNGGNGDAGNGGSGGYIEWHNRGWGGSFLTSAGAAINTGFTLPAEPAPNLGPRPFIVNANTTIDVYTSIADGLAGTVDGQCFLVLDDTNLYRRVNATISEVITGLQVNAGCTLTFGLNSNRGGNTGQDTAYVYFSDDIVIRGTVKVKDLTTGNLNGGVIEDRAGAPATAKDMGTLYLYCGYNCFVASTGLVDTSGVDAVVGSNERGGYGGACFVGGSFGVYLHGTFDASGGNGDGTGAGGNAAWFAGSSADVVISSDGGVIVNTGPIFCNGGNGTTGGQAGGIHMGARTFLYNTADLTANGGVGTSGNGGNAYYVGIESYTGSCYNSGDVFCNGGNGATGGGASGQVYFVGAGDGYIGDLFNSGNVVANGGNTASGVAGNGDHIYFGACGGDIRNTGNLSCDGGDTAGSGTVGGNAGYISFYCFQGLDRGNVSHVRPGDILVTGNLSMNGGNGGTGGSAGYIMVNNGGQNPNYYAPEQVVRLVGYSSISGNGGSGTVGGNGGYLDIEQEYGEWPQGAYICGPVAISGTTLNFNGGNSSNGAGGWGGYVYVSIEDNYPGLGPLEVKTNINCIGGNGSLSGGNGGYVALYAKEDITLSGNVNCSAGDGTGVNADGGSAGFYSTYVYSTNNVNISGTFTYEGGVGTGSGTGGNGGYIEVYAGARTTSTATFNFTGGASDAAAGTGGDGGYISLFSNRYPTSYTKTWNVSGGAANTDGDDGYVYVDWVCLARP